MAIQITPEELKKSAHEFRRMLLSVPAFALKDLLPYITVRGNVNYKQTTGQISNSAQFGPYDPKRKGNTTKIDGRTLESLLASVIAEFDHDGVFQSIYHSFPVPGEGLKNTAIAKAVLTAMMQSMSEGLHDHVFNAKRKDDGTTTVDLFNGFDTIANTEITAGNISTAKGNLFNFGAVVDNNNALEAAKEFYRSADPKLKTVKTYMYVPVDFLEAYEDDYQQSVGATPYNKSFEKTFLEGSRGLCEILPLYSKAGSDILQLTTKNNMILGSGSGGHPDEKVDVDRFSPFMLTMSAAIVVGAQYDSIHPRRAHFGKLKLAEGGE